MGKTVTEHFTSEGEILFASVAKAFKNKKTGKEEFSIKLKVKSDDPVVKHLKEIAEYKIDTKTNRALEGTGEIVINFASTFEPLVVSTEGKVIKDREIPFFDSRKDKGTAVVGYKVVDYGDNKIVRLSKVKFKSLEMAPRDGGDTLDQTLEKLKNI